MNDNKENNDKNKKMDPKKRRSLLVILIISLGFTLMLNGVMSKIKEGNQEKIEYSEFVSMLESGELESVEIQSDRLILTPKNQKNPVMKTTYYAIRTNDSDMVNRLQNAVDEKKLDTYGAPEESGSSVVLAFLASYILPFVIIYGAFYLFMRIGGHGGMMGNVGKSTAKVYMEKKTGVTFADVAGQDEAKESLTEMVDFLHNPGKYLKIGAKLPKGALLVGPPGTGKTLLAKAVAGEANVPFFSLSGSDFVEMFVGVGASRVRDLFKQAQAVAPCIIFIDEIDAIGKSRDSRYGGGNDEREQTLNQLLAEMDGFDTSKGLVILAATNRPEVLDKALLRPGRFDRRVIVERPDLKGRIETLKVHAKGVLMDDTVDFEEIALATSGAVGSDLANMINEAALGAVKAGRTAVSQADLFEAVEVVIAGKEKKDRILSPEEKKIVAYHEVGHALAIALQKHTEPVQKITIVPRTMGALGYTMQVPEEEKYLMNKDEMLSELVTFFGGRAAEEVKFQSVTTGASNDIERATNLARAMVTRYGMSDTFGLIGLETVENAYLDGRTVMNCSDQTAAKVDEEVMKVLKEAYDKALTLIGGHVEVLDAISEFLLEKETITGKEFMAIFNRLMGKEEAEDSCSACGEEEASMDQKTEETGKDGENSQPSGATTEETAGPSAPEAEKDPVDPEEIPEAEEEANTTQSEEIE